jgi:F0F1-type ATP synthase assembly protein I
MAQNKPWNPKEFGSFVSIGQIGMEMAVPIGIGVALDYYFNSGPWATIAGAVLGFTGGMAHLIALANKGNDASTSKRDSD